MFDNSYICPRCHYSTIYKKRMRSHFNRTTLCYKRTDLELTTEVQEAVLRDHVYYPPKKGSKPKSSPVRTVKINKQVNNIITNHHHMVTFVGKLDYKQKIKLLQKYQGIKLIGFEEDFEETFESKTQKLEDNSYPRPYQLSEGNFYQLVDDVTRIDQNRISQMNIIFNKKINRILFFSCGHWDSHLVERGVTELINNLKS